MPLLKLLTRFRERQRRTQIAQELAVAASQSVLGKVVGRIDDMTPAEIRGYIRAKATPLVQVRFDTFLHFHPTFPIDVREEFARQVSEHVVQLVVEELARRKVAPVIVRRLAA